MISSISIQSNPFAQAAGYWLLHFDLPQAIAVLADEYFSDTALSAASVEIAETPHLWRMEVLYEQAPENEDIERRLKVLSEQYEIAVPSYTVSPLAQKDWLAAVASDFPPLTIKRFYVHGSHVAERLSPSFIPIEIDAGLAFGSGEHATTSLCLQALEMLARKRAFTRVLDVGTGSGILAIAAAKRLKAARVIAADIDPVAVHVAKENGNINKVNIQTCVAAGYNAALIKKNAPYDLIFANILARPLMALAPDLAAHLAPGGIAILSGLLTTQETMVLAAHQAQRLNLIKRLRQGDWSALIIGR